MKNLEIKLQLPYNWGHIRKIGIYDNNNKRITKIMHGEHHVLKINDDATHIIVKLDFYRSEIEIPINTDDVYLALYMDFRDGFPFKYIDTLKRKCLTGKFMSREELENFDNSFYANAAEWVPVSMIDKPALVLGFVISAGLIITSLLQQDNPYRDIVFFIGTASIISLLMINAEKNKILLFDYKSRLIATVLAFTLAFIFLTPLLPVMMLFFIFIATFILRVVINFKTLKSV